MTRLVHLSDLHFGRVDARLVAPLARAVNALRPRLVVISGDLTQRARRWQFREARAFIDRIEAPVLAVPGNHDTPLDNLAVRLLRPWHRYRQHISDELEPVFRDDAMIVAGGKTVNRFAWQRGRMSERRVARLGAAFAEAGDRLCLAVLHHPLEHLPGTAKPPARGAEGALAKLVEAGVHIVLSGHIHTAHVQPFSRTPAMLFVQAGTGLSDRLRGVRNSFNILDIAPPKVSLSHVEADGNARFSVTEQRVFARTTGAWRELHGSEAPAVPPQRLPGTAGRLG